MYLLPDLVIHYSLISYIPLLIIITIGISFTVTYRVMEKVIRLVAKSCNTEVELPPMNDTSQFLGLSCIPKNPNSRSRFEDGDT